MHALPQPCRSADPQAFLTTHDNPHRKAGRGPPPIAVPVCVHGINPRRIFGGLDPLLWLLPSSLQGFSSDDALIGVKHSVQGGLPDLIQGRYP